MKAGSRQWAQLHLSSVGLEAGAGRADVEDSPEGEAVVGVQAVEGTMGEDWKVSGGAGVGKFSGKDSNGTG